MGTFRVWSKTGELYDGDEVMVKSLTEMDESRRRFLIYLLSTGAFAAMPGCAGTAPSNVRRAMPTPQAMPAGMSVFQIVGSASVNGASADLDTGIEPGDVVETGEDSEVVFVVEKDAFLMRANSRMRIPTRMTGGSYELEKGKALGVFASRQTGIRTPSAVIAIRGTGIYVETEPELSYVCTCYGIANLATADDQSINETIESEHHDAPRYILADSNAADRIQPAPFKNHDDQELLMIETLVGRSTPYVVPQGVRRSRGTYR